MYNVIFGHFSPWSLLGPLLRKFKILLDPHHRLPSPCCYLLPSPCSLILSLFLLHILTSTNFTPFYHFGYFFISNSQSEAQNVPTMSQYGYILNLLLEIEQSGRCDRNLILFYFFLKLLYIQYKILLSFYMYYIVYIFSFFLKKYVN